MPALLLGLILLANCPSINHATATTIPPAAPPPGGSSSSSSSSRKVGWCPALVPRPGMWRLSRRWSDPVQDFDSKTVRGAAFVTPYMHWEQDPECSVPAEERGECVWRVNSRESFIARFRNRRIAFIGDSVQRSMMVGIAYYLAECAHPWTAFGPDSPDTPALCAGVWASFMAHDSWQITLPPRLGNITMKTVWCPHARDLLGMATDLFTRKPEDGGWDVMTVGLGFWDVKDHQWGGHGAAEMVTLMPTIAASIKANVLPVNPSIARRLVVLSQSNTEPYEGRSNDIPNHLIDQVREAWLGAFRSIGMTVFDAGEYYKLNPEKVEEYGGGRYVTGDGFHPPWSVAMTVMRDIASHWALVLEEEEGGGGGGGGSRGAAGSSDPPLIHINHNPVSGYGETTILVVLLLFATILTLSRWFVGVEKTVLGSL